ncbi:MAG TPA: FIST N-terminal domain-containing protein [Candidatus Margulisiibacteriota bacterium]|nr:FIST N-terminal domain-containing protein [Candidatus Margulisiibacteriota bacterium]
MRWASAVADAPLLEEAARTVASQLRVQLGNVRPDLLVVFVSMHHAAHFDALPTLLATLFDARVLIGCSAGGVIGAGREIEQRPGLSVTAALLPGVDVVPFHVAPDAPLGEQPAAVWEQRLGVPVQQQPAFVLLPEPFSCDVEAFVRGLDRVYLRSHTVGGLASGGRHAGSNALFLGRRVHRGGLVGVALTGDIEVDTIVAQGCRPIGQPMFVTKCQGNVLWELDGASAVQVLRDLYEQLDPTDQELAQHSLFLGIVMTEDRQEYRQGDFLIRNIMGMDPARGVLAVGALLRETSVVQFHLRDAKTSGADLAQLLARYEPGATAPQGALLFSCLGRGVHLYGRPDHDTDAFRERFPAVALAGFFCNGEIGPVHGTTFLHGYTSSFGLFRRRRG